MRALLCGFALLGTLPPGAQRAHGQVLPIVAGGVGGLAAGGWTTIGTFVARSRMGNYIFQTDDLQAIRLETLPILVFPLAGALLGAHSSRRLTNAGIGAGLGLVGGGGLGIAVGALVSDTSEARWAGGIIGSAAGLVVGAVVGGLAVSPEDGAPPGVFAPSLSIRIPLGGDP
jgi:tetrahydromethanopterin S-methyltransferase subunit C